MSQVTLSLESKKECEYSCLTNDPQCPELRACEVRKKLLQHINARYTSAKNDALYKHFIDPPLKSDIQTLFYNSLKKGLVCRYCCKPLEIFAKKEDIRFAISLDHVISLSTGGNNKLQNLELICHRCNIVKNKVHPDHFDFIATSLKDKYGIEGLNNYLEALYPTLFATFVKKRIDDDRGSKIE